MILQFIIDYVRHFGILYEYSVVGTMELNQGISTGILQLLLTSCVAYGSAITYSGINLYISLIRMISSF